jgi:hypothetical protein
MVLIAWGAALAGLAYSAFTLRLLQLGYLQKPRDRARLAVLCAVLLSAWWAWSELAARLTGIPAFFLAGALADVSRYACWFAFMLTLLRPDGQTQRITGVQWLVPAALGLTCFAFLALALLTLQIRVFGDPARLVLFASMALPVLGLVLIEQLVRNMEKDSLWSIKPLCLGLASAFMFDAYVYSQAVLFNQPDAAALSIRGVVHALVVPLLVAVLCAAQPWLYPHAFVSYGSLSHGKLANGWHLFGIYFQFGPLNAIFWRRMGGRTATRFGFCGFDCPGRLCFLRLYPRQAQGILG